MRIQRPRMRREFTLLKDCEPPETWPMARVRPCVGRTLPVVRGIQSIWFLKTAVCSDVAYLISSHTLLRDNVGQNWRAKIIKRMRSSK